MIPFALALLQVQTIPLTPYPEDGPRRLVPAQPLFLPLARKGALQTTIVRFGAKAFPVTLVDTKGNRVLSVAGKKFPMARQDVKAPDGKNVTIYQGKISLPVKGQARYAVRSFVSDTQAAGFEQVRGRLMLTPEFGYLGNTHLGGKKVLFGIRGGDPARAMLIVDRNGDGRLGDLPAEVYRLDQPFNIGGTTYKLATFQPEGRPSVSFAVSSKKVAEIPMPPDLIVGKVAPPLMGKTLDGKAITFPKSWPGKLVLLDVWATWCGPCVGEIPYMKAAYAKYKSRGFEIVSFSIDDPGKRSDVAAFTKAKGSSWVQVYEGQGWGGPTPKRYNITGIPFMLLVDGSTGKIVATENSLRGPSLEPTIAGLLAKRGW